MSYFSEAKIEHDFIDFFQKQKYQYLSKDEINKLREYKKSNVILKEIFLDQIKQINPNIQLDEIKYVYTELYKIMSSTAEHNLESNNNQIIKLIKNGIVKKRESDGIYHTWKIFDFENPEKNNFICTNQFEIIGSQNSDSQKNIPDIVIFINGLPVIVGELKTYYQRENELEKAETQIRNYAFLVPKLFVFNFFSFISNYVIIKIGNPLNAKSVFNHWRGLKTNLVDVKSIVLFNKLNLLEFFKSFIFYDADERKIIARHYQYHAIKETSKNFKENNNKVGIIWHTQGTGKSLTMVLLVKFLRKIKENLTVLVITDRNDLDTQLHKTFQNAFQFLGEKPIQFKTSTEIKEKLENNKTHGIFFSTIQKFRDANLKVLNDRNDILVITDEAHRSHNSADENFKKILYKKNLPTEEEYLNPSKKYAQILREALPNAKFIGFTGTPIEEKDIQTKRVFGEYIHIYSMQDALLDKAIVPIFYENANTKSALNKEQLEIINQIDLEEEKFIYESKNIKLKQLMVQEKNKTKYKAIQNFLSSEERIKNVVNHFIKHYERTEHELEGKAMFIAFHRELAFKYYKKIIQKRPEWQTENKIKLIVSPNKEIDSPEMTKLLGSKEERQNIINSFKLPDSKIKILIVVDMLLTGYDVP
ncbi:type I restriction endonuclease subunit R [Mycoplasmopsis cricetuli]|uniref:type I restriction endonuclease subunit R n=1 Tax=Mycoplasmopsis cricetuli TaxID=171283 RepID=UPI000472AC03|nr:HsdR family type I site-specific deoxyribonuclease [Mycoplasmopsis cricetuli]